MIIKQFQCPSCEADGKITVKGDDFKFEDFEVVFDEEVDENFEFKFEI
jgi:hypothetical protein